MKCVVSRRKGSLLSFLLFVLGGIKGKAVLSKRERTVILRKQLAGNGSRF